MKKKDMELAADAAETVFRRLPMIWWQMLNPTAKGEAEMVRMVAEKQKAMFDGIMAAQMQMAKEAFRPWSMPWTAPNPEAAARRVAAAALAPMRRTARANARRLRK